MGRQDAGYFADGEASGRVTHTTLMNIVRARKVVELEDGQYSYPPNLALLEPYRFECTVERL